MAKSSLHLQLLVILWKNCIVRKFHWFLTIVEIAVPVTLFVLVAYARAEISAMGKEYIPVPTYNNIYQSEELFNNKFNHDFKIYYCPTTAFSSRLIENVQLLFSLPNEAIKSFSSISELSSYYEKYGRDETGIMAVIFNNLDGDEVPKRLDYIIRPYESYIQWDTEALFNVKHNYIPEAGSEIYMNRGFMAMKMALDKSFVDMTIGSESPLSFVVQEFPYPPHQDDKGIGDFFLHVLPQVTVFSFVFLCPSVLKRIVEDKSTGITELMKMMGLKSWMLWLGWFLHAFFVNLFSVGIIVFVLKLNISGAEYSALEYCSGYVFFSFLLLYVAATITFLFALSTLFSRPTIGMVAGILLFYITYIVPSNLIVPNMKWYKKILLSIFPNMALQFGYDAIATFETREIGVNWSNLFDSPTGGKQDITMGNVFIMFIIDIIFYMLITVYIDAINPGPYGLAKSCTFPVRYISNCIFKRTGRVIDKEEADVLQEYCTVEEAPNLVSGIKIKNLYKTFGKLSVVNGLSMNIYEGEITALLGHNGAGKTTTMSIITGLIGATNGKVCINGKDIKTHISEVRSSLGLCPQHNLHFSDLTVMQHLKFFGMLKGSSMKEATAEAEMLLARMNIAQKKHHLASSLSGGMKRKLSLAIALIGNPRVVILDEPTSGLDPESRREIWDMLLTLRGSRTILITTHFMEEADVLGDRIAIMDHGRLVCYGTSMFLKKEFGAGYHLSLIRNSNETVNNQVNEITNIVNSVIPNAVLEAHSGNYITFLLPHETKSSFSQLLEKLEKIKDNLGISNITISVTTLEEVFLRVGSMVLTNDDKLKSVELGSTKRHGTVSSLTNLQERFTASASVKSTGSKKLKLQIISLMKKRILVVTKKWFVFTSQVILAVLIMLLTLYLGGSVSQSSKAFDHLDFNLSIYGDTKVFFGGAENDSELSEIMHQYKRAIVKESGLPINVPSVSEAILAEGIKNIEFYNYHMIVAAEFNKTSSGNMINAMFSNNAVHGAPISLNLVMNAVLKALKGEEYSIVSSNYPLPTSSGYKIQEASEIDVATLWLLLFPLGMLFISSTFVLFPQMERITNIKQLQLMCGIRSFLYWGTCYVCDFVLYLAAVAVIIFVALLYGFTFSNVFSGMNEIGALLAILTVYGICVIPCSYLFSYKKTAAGSFALFLICGLFISVIMTFVVKIMQLSMVEKYEKIGSVLKSIMYLFPQFGLTFSCMEFSQKAVRNYNWKIKSPEQKSTICHYQSNPCCGGDSTIGCKRYQSYLYGSDTIGTDLLIMLFSTFMYFALLLVLETNYVHKLWDKLIMVIYKKIHRAETYDVLDGMDDNDVKYESQRVYDTLKKEESRKRQSSIISDDETDLLLVHNLQKIYGGQKVVKGISFGVKPGDCFGLLGVNGAGKTTTFRILTGDQPLISGEARICFGNEVVSISKETNKYLENVGYCPQFDPINEVLTGRQMLRLFAELRGISEGVDEEVNMWLQALGFEEFADKECGCYSGGNKRKLCIAIALIGGPLLVMLDEPTSGVDPISRRKLWDTVNLIQCQTPKPSIILTSHSMEECEVLCNKLAIMKAGQLECYGTIPKLKEKYGQGFTVMLKLKQYLLNVIVNSLNQDDGDSTASQSQPLSASSTRNNVDTIATVQEDSEELKNLMKTFENQYKGFCTLRDKHTGLLHYHINDKRKRWSDLFKEIEQLKQQHSIIEDYNISETTLEEVFLSIARSDNKLSTEIVL